ncbi:MAG TPA: hypothetical protein VFQ39_12115 [Longimicrobium sp.]|nr:hypothetical protein [Longimicrobium sp.]
MRRLRSTIPLALALRAACRGATPERPLTAADLAGTWEMAPRGRGPHGPVAARGIVTFPADSVKTDCMADRAPCAAAAGAPVSIETKPLLGHTLWFRLEAALFVDGDVLMMLGECCDRGELGMRGRLRRGGISGRWSETFVSAGAGRRGRFTLRRPDDVASRTADEAEKEVAWRR